jgi:NAD(P)-dependent dehydrogenase (short-subunit alcohol dehydrogenase family)
MTALSDRSYIVTGAASGIGFGVVTKLVAEGANVLMVDLKQEALASAG